MRQNITQHSDSELSLLVYNDETLYNMRHDTELLDYLNELFIFREEQLLELETDLEIELLEQDTEGDT
jgi:hypothetical protein